MEVFVINLEKDVERLAHVSAQLQNAHLDFERIQGVYGKDLSADELRENYDDGRAKWHQARSLTRAEIGCSLSHIKTLRTILERNLPRALILEDDVVLPVDTGGVLDALVPHLPQDEPIVCLLSPSTPGPRPWTNLDAGQHALAPYAEGFYTSSYVVTRAAAAALLRELHPVSYVPDPWPRLHRFGVVKLLVTVPAVVFQDQETFGSHTTDDVKKAFGASRSTFLSYKARRVRNVIWDAVTVAWKRRENQTKVR